MLLLALLASVGINAGLTAGIVIATKDTKVGDGGLLVSSDTGEVLKVASAEFGVKAIVAPESPTFTDTAETVSVLVDASGGAVATAAAVNENRVLVDSRGGAVKTEEAQYVSQFGVVELVDRHPAAFANSVFLLRATSAFPSKRGRSGHFLSLAYRHSTRLMWIGC